MLGSDLRVKPISEMERRPKVSPRDWSELECNMGWQCVVNIIESSVILELVIYNDFYMQKFDNLIM